MIPWEFKLLYGIICDTVLLPGYERSPKKGYMICMGVLQSIALLFVASIEFNNYLVFMYLITLVSFCGAFMDVVIDGIMTVQQRRDSENGAADLQTISWLC
jgi:hypothetical protein